MDRSKKNIVGWGVPIYRVELVREADPAEMSACSIQTSADAVQVFQPLFGNLDREHFLVALLDAKHRPIGLNVVSVGSLTSAVVHPREVFKAAIIANAAALILSHNHPSNDVTPSSEDTEITRRLRDAGELLGIRVLDHVIVGTDSHFSFVDAGHW